MMEISVRAAWAEDHFARVGAMVNEIRQFDDTISVYDAIGNLIRAALATQFPEGADSTQLAAICASFLTQCMMSQNLPNTPDNPERYREALVLAEAVSRLLQTVNAPDDGTRQKAVFQ